MAYLQTTANNVSDMLDTIASFATGLGWTVERNNTQVSDGNRRILSLSRASADYAHFFSGLSFDTIHTMRSIGIDTGATWSAQPNRGCYSQSNFLSAGPYANFWLFGESGSNPYIHCVVEHAAGRYRHFGVGQLIKRGTWTGGSYSYGTYWSQASTEIANASHPSHDTPFSEARQGSSSTAVGCIRCDDTDATANNIAGVDNRYLPYNSSSSRRAATGFRGGNHGYVQNGMGLSGFGFTNYNQRGHLIRFQNFVTVSGGFWRPIGEPPGLRATNMNPYVAGEEVTIGSDIWKIFPLARKGITAGLESSGDQAIAYKKVV